MLIKLLIGSVMIIINLGIQVWAVTLVVTYFQKRIDDGRISRATIANSRVLATIMLFLLAGHILQFATWALLFIYLGEFQDFATAFYHSTVNFTSLGYGDIVMSDEWRLLGALEAANGVLMFGLTAGLVLSVMTPLFKRNESVSKFLDGKGADT